MASFNFRSREPRDFMSSERQRQRMAAAGGTPQPQHQQRAEPPPSLPSLQFQDTTSEDDGGWLASSYELRHGLQVSEESIDTLPAELRDAFDLPDAPPGRRRGRG